MAVRFHTPPALQAVGSATTSTSRGRLRPGQLSGQLCVKYEGAVGGGGRGLDRDRARRSGPGVVALPGGAGGGRAGRSHWAGGTSGGRGWGRGGGGQTRGGSRSHSFPMVQQHDTMTPGKVARLCWTGVPNRECRKGLNVPVFITRRRRAAPISHCFWRPSAVPLWGCSRVGEASVESVGVLLFGLLLEWASTGGIYVIRPPPLGLAFHKERQTGLTQAAPGVTAPPSSPGNRRSSTW